MNIEEIREYCLGKELTIEDMPFGNTSLVFKVNQKMFALLSLVAPFWINLKCNPEKAIELREHYMAITPGYHMNKIHWNTIDIEANLPDSLIKELIDHSYELVKKKTTAKKITPKR